MPATTKRATAALIVVVVIAALGWVSVWATSAGSTPEPPASPTPTEPASDGADELAALFAAQASDVQVRGTGRVVRLLPDDLEGDRHQRFILELRGGMTVLIAHNIDGFPRLPGLAVGDEVGFHGEYEWTELGGTVHWTHRDNRGDHVDGWLDWNGTRYW